MALSVDEVINILNVVPVDKESRSEILKRINDLEKEKKADRENSKVPKPKKEAFVVLKSLKGEVSNEDFVAAVFLGDEGVDHAQILTSLRGSAVDFNIQRKKKAPILSFTAILEFLKPKWLKNGAVPLRRLTNSWQQVIVLPFEQDENFIKIEKIAD